jgi:hypothetical protein
VPLQKVTIEAKTLVVSPYSSRLSSEKVDGISRTVDTRGGGPSPLQLSVDAVVSSVEKPHYRGLLEKWGAAAPTHASGAGTPVLRRSDNVADLVCGVEQWFPRHLSRRRRTKDDEA